MLALGIAILSLLISVAAYARSRVAERAINEIVAAMVAPSDTKVQNDPYRTL